MNLQGWMGDEIGIERDDIEIVREVRNGPTVTGAAQKAGMTFAVVTSPPDVRPGGVSEKHISARVEAGLRAALQTSAEFGQPREIDVVRDCDKDIGVFRARLVGEEGS